MTVPTISVIIPTYDRQRQTELAIASALTQSEPPLEIVVVDDASPTPFFWPGGCHQDTGGDAVRARVASPQEVTVRLLRRPKNGGAGAARQCGIEAARGTHVAFLDSDDRWARDKLAQQLPHVVSRPDGLVAVACGWRERPGNCDAAPKVRIPRPCRYADDFLSGCWYCPGSTVILPRGAFDRIGPFDPALRRLEDLEWFLRFGLSGGKLVVAPVIAVEIAKGGRSRIDPVETAAIRIQESAQRAGADRRGLRCLRAFLFLERAAAARHERRFWRMCRMLAWSYIERPRARLHLQDWWPTSSGATGT